MTQRVSITQHLSESAAPVVGHAHGGELSSFICSVSMLDGTLHLQSHDAAVLQEIGEAFLEAARRLDAAYDAAIKAVSA